MPLPEHFHICYLLTRLKALFPLAMSFELFLVLITEPKVINFEPSGHDHRAPWSSQRHRS